MGKKPRKIKLTQTLIKTEIPFRFKHPDLCGNKIPNQQLLQGYYPAVNFCENVELKENSEYKYLFYSCNGIFLSEENLF